MMRIDWSLFGSCFPVAVALIGVLPTWAGAQDAPASKREKLEDALSDAISQFERREAQLKATLMQAFSRTLRQVGSAKNLPRDVKESLRAGIEVEQRAFAEYGALPDSDVMRPALFAGWPGQLPSCPGREATRER